VAGHARPPMTGVPGLITPYLGSTQNEVSRSLRVRGIECCGYSELKILSQPIHQPATLPVGGNYYFPGLRTPGPLATWGSAVCTTPP